MRVYHAFGHVLASTCELPELEAAKRVNRFDGSRHASIAITVGPAGVGPLTDDPLTVSADDGTASPNGGDPYRGDPWLRVDRSDDRYVLRFGAAGTFSVSADARSIHVHHAEEPLSDQVRHLLIDQVVPLVLAHREQLILHASAVSLGGHAVALVGPSGAGKSTLAAALARRHGAVLADDALLVQVNGPRALAVPAYSGLRVWPDALPLLGCSDRVPRVSNHTEKRRVSLATAQASEQDEVTLRFGEAECPLSRLYVLSETEVWEPRLSPLAKREAVMAILAHTYVLDTGDTPRLGRQLTAACDVIDRTVTQWLSYPWDLSRLDEVAEVIARDLPASASDRGD